MNKSLLLKLLFNWNTMHFNEAADVAECACFITQIKRMAENVTSYLIVITVEINVHLLYALQLMHYRHKIAIIPENNCCA